jgi:hypothetical protein
VQRESFLEPSIELVTSTEIDIGNLYVCNRVFKIFRALLEIAIVFGLISTNPSLKIANTAPKGRSAIWSGDEIVALRDKAWELGYHGLAVAIAVAHDTQLAPVDVY